MPFSEIRFDGAFSFALLRQKSCSFRFVPGLEPTGPGLRKGQDMYFNQVEFGKRLQEFRKLQKMTQEELAELVGVEKQHISRIERGVAACSIDLLPTLSVTLQVSTDYLLIGKSIDKELTRTQLLSVISQLTLITQGL